MHARELGHTEVFHPAAFGGLEPGVTYMKRVGLALVKFQAVHERREDGRLDGIEGRRDGWISGHRFEELPWVSRHCNRVGLARRPPHVLSFPQIRVPL